MIPSISVKKWGSKSALLGHLDGIGARTVVVGLTAEAPRNFYSFSILPGPRAIEIGVLSSGLGTDPAAVVLNTERRALVGHDTWLTWIDIENVAIVASQRLGGVFYEFLPVDRNDEIVVVHELGVLRVDASGSVKWAVDTDVVKRSCTDADGNLVLTVLDQDSRVVVSLETGRVSR